MKFHFCRAGYLTLYAHTVDIEQELAEEEKAQISFSIGKIPDENRNILLSDLVKATMKALQKAANALAKSGIDPFSKPVEFEFSGTLRGLTQTDDIILNIAPEAQKR